MYDSIVGLGQGIQNSVGQNCWIRTRDTIQCMKELLDKDKGFSVGQNCWIRTSDTIKGRTFGLEQGK